MERIPGGYPRDKAIEQAGAIRVTRPGLDLIGAEAPRLVGDFLGAKDGVVTFDIPTTTFVADIPIAGDTDVTICDQGPGGDPPRCRATIGIGATVLHVDAVTPNEVSLSGTVPLELSRTHVELTDVIAGADIGAEIGYGENPSCDGDRHPVTEGPHAVPVSINIPIVKETTPPRNGYTKLDVENARINLDGITEDEVQICMNCGFVSGVCNGIANSVKGSIVDSLKEGVGAQLNSFLATAFCTKPGLGDPACPTGSSATGQADAGGTCNFDGQPDRCVSALLGTDAHVNLAGLLAKFSPGSKGALDFGFAAGGDMTPFPNAPADDVGYPGHTPNGITLAMVGGVLPSPESKCVVPAALEVPTGIPIPTELTADTLPSYGDGTKGPDVGLGLSQRFLNFSMKSAYNSGLLCLGVSSEQVSLLQSGLLSVLVASLPQFTFDRKSASAAIATRPGKPPELTLGGGTNVNTDPMVKVAMPEFAIDFYVWSYDRYVRVFTFTADVTVPINLSTAATEANPAGGVVIQLGDVKLENGKVDNNELLLDKPEQMAGAISQVVGSLVGQFVGSGLAPFDVSQLAASFGFTLTIPDGGIRTLQKDQDQFIGLFANFVASGAPTPTPPRPSLQKKSIDPAAMTLRGYRDDLRPSLTLSIPPVGPEADLEYATRIDKGGFSAWLPASADGTRVVTGPELFMQGRHELRVYARHHGQPASQSEAGVLPFVIDVLAPTVALQEKAGHVSIEAWDVVSDEKALVARIAYDGAPLADEWKPLSEIALDESRESVELQVRDEEGNIGQLKQPLIRGNRDATIPAVGGCNCDTGPNGTTPGEGALWAAGIVAALFLFKRRSRGARHGKSGTPLFTALVATGAAAALAPGCSCGSDDPDVEVTTTGCGEDCNQECAPGLPVGIVGAYTSLAKADDGTLWVAGYNDSTLSPEFSALYGDLVAGTFDAAAGLVRWQTIDGVPAREAGKCPVNDPKGWRGGETESGNNVGLWTSMAIGADQKPMIAYYDATTPALKFAVLGAAPVGGVAPASAWKIHEVSSKPAADIGRYAKMILDGDKPVIAYLHFEPGTDGAVRSKIMLARAKIATPLSATDWTLSEVAHFEDNPCRYNGCGTGRVCQKGGEAKCLSQGSGCTPADCGGSGSACAMVGGVPTCVTVLASNSVEAYPNMAGIYVSLAKGKNGLGVVAYDRVHGNLLGFREKGATFEPLLLDGETTDDKGERVDTGDTGIASSLTIDESGRWHVAYVEGLDESVRYLTVDVDGTISKPSIVDDGFGIEGVDRFPDGQHVVGDDATVRVNGGVVTVFYQDATVGSLRYATASGTGDAIKWTRKAIGKSGRLGGLFPRPVPGETRVSNFVRVTDQTARTMTGDVEIVDAR